MDKEIYITGQLGMRGYGAARMLMEKGYKVNNLDGGFKLYGTLLPERVVYWYFSFSISRFSGRWKPID